MHRIIPDELVLDQITALPTKVLQFYAEALDVLQLAPENGVPYNKADPDGLLELLFGAEKQGKITYLLLKDQREVHILNLLWID